MWKRSIILLWVVFVIRVNGETCSFVVDENSECLQIMDCQTGGNSLKIYENCQPGTLLFTFTTGSMIADGSCPFLEVDTVNNQLKMKQPLDAETFVQKDCRITSDGKGNFVNVENLNEFFPQPVDGNKVQEINVEENLPPGDILSFTYKDDDLGETGQLTITLLTTDVEDVFSIAKANGAQGMDFTLSTKISLDYEARMFYKMDFNITSTDSSNNKLATKHTVFVYVDDMGDNPPYWLESHPIAQLDEGPADRVVYTVRAEDRDLVINNPVKYKFVSGNDEGFFELDNTTGTVTLVKEIDREEDTSFFILEIEAQEYDPDGNPAPDPSKSVTVTNLNIMDVNDNFPSFSQSEYEIDMLEVNQVDVFMDVDIFVFDMDPEGSNGRYIITSDHPDDIRITPSDSLGNSSLQITAIGRQNTVFEYENTQLVTITLTATEKADASHIGTTILYINLTDVNDHAPAFEQEEYQVGVKEDAGKGYSLVKVSATDDDLSSYFGTQSIKYRSGCSILEVNDTTGEVTLGQNNALDYETNPIVLCDIYAEDNQGDAPSNSGSSTLRISVSDVVDSPPLITVHDAEITEGSSPGTVIGEPITATDKDVDAKIEFYINWDSSTATSNGVETSINYVVGWFEIEQLSAGDKSYSAQLKVGSTTEIDREIADKVRLSIVVNDTNTESGASADSGFVNINIIDVKDTTPVLNSMFGLQVTENSPNETLIATIVAVDPDLEESVTFEISDDSMVYLEKSPENEFEAYLKVADDNIDRELQQKIIIDISVTDSVGLSSTKQFEITVMDVNDNPPTFEKDVILASFTENDVSGKAIQTFEAKDNDLNVTLTYSLAGDFEWNEGGPVPPPTEPFLIQTSNNRASLILNFNPLGINSGFCNFTIVCHDNDGLHSTSVQGKVYAITIAYQINVIFIDPLSEVQSQSSKIADIFGSVYGYPCIIDSIAENLPSKASKAEEQTLVKMHFIDESKDEPVPTEVIMEATNDAELAQELFTRLNALGLSLQTVGNNIVSNKNKTDSQVLLLQILLAVVSLVLGSFLLLLLITYCVRTRRLERKLRVAKATTFGSTSSNLNRVDMVGVPGSNKFAGEGANPMYNVAEADLRNDDASSTSGDSVLVGVEENPEFREYGGVRAPPEDSKGTFSGSYDNTSFSRSIDDIEGPSPFAGGSRTNPLLDADLGDDGFDLAEARDNYDMFVRRNSGSSGESFGANTNPNFSFGPTK